MTAPTNGAAGAIPAVLRYDRDYCMGSSHEALRTLLLTAAAIGSLFKMNAGAGMQSKYKETSRGGLVVMF